MNTNSIETSVFLEIVNGFAAAMEENSDYLTTLDAAIGDGDHGRNMAHGFASVREELPVLGKVGIGPLLRAVGLNLVSSVGGASGPLYGAVFIEAGIAAGPVQRVDLHDLALMMRAGCDALARRGRCKVGDKTIMDALEPATRTLEAAAAQRAPLLEAVQASVEAARQGMLSTIPLVARCGLAMQYGERSAGHQDAGATSCYLLLNSIPQTIARLGLERER